MKQTLGLHVTADGVYAVEIVAADNTYHLATAGEWPGTPDTPGKEFSARLTTFVQTNNVQAREAAVAVDTSLALLHQFPLGRHADRRERETRAQWEIRQLYPEAETGDFITDMVELERNSPGGWTRFLLVGVRRTLVHMLRTALAENGIRLRIVDVDVFGAEYLWRRLDRTPDRKVVLLGLHRGIVDVSEADAHAFLGFSRRACPSPDACTDILREIVEAAHPPERVYVYGSMVTREVFERLGIVSDKAKTELLDPFRLPGMGRTNIALYHIHQLAAQFAPACGMALRED
jgi:hypothetical protein